MKADEIIFRILDQLRSGQLSDDNNYSQELIYNQIVSCRSRLIRQERSAAKWLSSLYLQDLPSVELVKADKHDHCIVSPYECTILRSKNPLPKFVDTSHSDLVTFVGTTEGQRFERSTYNASEFMSYSKYTGHKTKFYFVGDYIYIIKPKTNLLKYISIQGVFEDPKQAASYQSCGNVDCFEGFSFEFPISATLVDTLIQLVITEIRGSRLLPSDKTNDGQDN